jgi:hypothetical protein
MHICTSQSLFSHWYVVNEWLNRHCNVQIDIGIRADELGIEQMNWALVSKSSNFPTEMFISGVFWGGGISSFPISFQE